tara:strand:+ start:176 stop:610 length:435 start_codon:yes stop_codon:yes gene_type:complete
MAIRPRSKTNKIKGKIRKNNPALYTRSEPRSTKPKKKKLPHEKLLDKYLKGDIPATIPWGTKKLKDWAKKNLEDKPFARTGPAKPKTKKKPGFKDVMGPRQIPKKPKVVAGGPWNPKDKKDPVAGGPYKPKKGPKYMKPMSKRK